MSSTPVEVRRSSQQRFVARNERGGEVPIGPDGAPEAFTPGELLLAAIAGCSGLTGEQLLIRRVGETAPLSVHADRSKDPQDPHKFSSIQVSFDVDLSGVDDAERGKLVAAVESAVDRLCTVSRSVEEGTPITVSLPR